jgi:hypothetical protein
VGPRPQHDVLAVQPNQLGNSESGLHGNQDKGSIATPDPGGTIQNCEQGIDLFPIKEPDRPSYVAFVGHCQDPLTVQGIGGLL